MRLSGLSYSSAQFVRLMSMVRCPTQTGLALHCQVLTNAFCIGFSAVWGRRVRAQYHSEYQHFPQQHRRPGMPMLVYCAVGSIAAAQACTSALDGLSFTSAHACFRLGLKSISRSRILAFPCSQPRILFLFHSSCPQMAGAIYSLQNATVNMSNFTSNEGLVCAVASTGRRRIVLRGS